MTLSDETYMRHALELAARGAGRVAPNPMVGAVIVRDGEILAEGWHHKYGDLHAERDALSKCGGKAPGATMYVTLEPCCHQGKQPPCTEAVIASGVARVVLGSDDPNPLVAGKGAKALHAAGIEVTAGVLKDECDALNEFFMHFITTKRPFTVMKYAMSLDGKIACYTGESRWVSGEESRRDVHELRNACSGIMVGIGTVLADDPMLNCRIEGGVDPVRIVCDTNLRIPLDSKIVMSAHETKTIVATCAADAEKTAALEACGVEVLMLPKHDDHVDLDILMDSLGQRDISSVLVEGGARLNWSLLEQGLVNRVRAYIAPKLFGGDSAKSPIGGRGFDAPDFSTMLRDVQVKQFGQDIRIEGSVIR